MLTKTQLQQEVQNLETQLQEFRQQLNNYKEVTIETASVGDTLENGSIVLKKENGLALLIAPKSTEVRAPWTKEFSEVFDSLQSQGFNPSQWFIPTKEQLLLAYETNPNVLCRSPYWSSTEDTVAYAYSVYSFTGVVCFNKSTTNCVRAFRCVTY